MKVEKEKKSRSVCPPQPFSLSLSSFVSLRLARNDDDEEEAARERRRRARQERMKSRDSEEPSGQPDSLVLTNSHR